MINSTIERINHLQPVILKMPHLQQISDEDFKHLCQLNDDYCLEMSARGELIIMPPVGGISGKKEADLITNLMNWNRQKKLGEVFSSSTIFRLPKGGKRSPDVAWVSLENWEKLTEKEQEAFPPICPDFVIELRSKTDLLSPLQAKMIEYLNSGLKLGWLINPHQNQVEIYRQNQLVEILDFPVTLSGENILPDFTLDLPF